MSSSVLSTTGRQVWAGLRVMVVMTIVLGLGYPLLLTAIARLAFHNEASGSLVERRGSVVGSSLIGQSFTGNPAYFQSRPSASGYDPLATGASNLGPNSPVLLKSVEQRRAATARRDGVPPAAVAPDALLASGSGLDPDISPAYAAEQVQRVARARGLSVQQVRTLVAERTQGREWGFLGEPRVNVLELNLELDRLTGPPK